MKVRQHLPGFAEREPETGEATTREELLALPFIARWATRPDFHRFSVERRVDPRGSDCAVMAELRGGQTWQVIAYLPIEMPEDWLPAWERPEGGE